MCYGPEVRFSPRIQHCRVPIVGKSYCPLPLLTIVASFNGPIHMALLSLLSFTCQVRLFILAPRTEGGELSTLQWH